MKPDARKLALAVLKCKGPLTDAELAWYFRVVYKLPESAARRARYKLTEAGTVRFARQVKVTELERIQKKWEVSPRR
jgi:hypothetical protein